MVLLVCFVSSESVNFTCETNLDRKLIYFEDKRSKYFVKEPNTAKLNVTVHSPCPLFLHHHPLLTVHCLLPNAYSPLSTPHCLLPTVHCPLSTSYCQLPTVHCASCISTASLVLFAFSMKIACQK
jgi:hypothetical protein